MLFRSSCAYRRTARYLFAGLVLVVAGLLTVHFLTTGVAPTLREPLTGTTSDSLSPDQDAASSVTQPDLQTGSAGDRLDASDTAATVAVDASIEDSADVGPADIVRIPIPAELASWFEADPERAAAHEQLERELRHPERAPFLEAGFRDFFDSRPDLTNTQILSIECRSEGCEILAMGYGDAAFQTWFEAVGEVFDSGWIKDMPDPPAFEGEHRGGLGCWHGELGPSVTALGCMFRFGDPDPTALNPSGLTVDDFLTAESPEALSEDTSRVPVPEDMVPLLQGDAELAQLHLRIERESTDLSWSVFAEDRIRAFLTNDPAFESSNILLVECRTTLCEIQFQTPDDSSAVNLFSNFPDFYEQTGVDVADAGMNGASLANGQIGIIFVLERRSIQSEAQ